jgi:hypothetical protein
MNKKLKIIQFSLISQTRDFYSFLPVKKKNNMEKEVI